jgi:hypothetical protein
LVIAFVPFAFWFANRGAFNQRKNGEMLRVLLALGLSVVFAAISFLPFLGVHTLLGGRE